MESRPLEITEDDHDKGMDLQGLSWGIGDIPVKEDFREKRFITSLSPKSDSRVKDYGSLIVKPPPQPASVNPVYHPMRGLANSRPTTLLEFITSTNSATRILPIDVVYITFNYATSSPQPPKTISITSTTTVSVAGIVWPEPVI